MTTRWWTGEQVHRTSLCRITQPGFLFQFVIHHEAHPVHCYCAAPGGGRSYCRQSPVQEDQEGACESPPCWWRQGSIWLLLREERRLLPGQRRPVHGVAPPFVGSCERNGNRFFTGQTYKENCNLCTCGTTGRWECEQNACLMDPDMIHAVNRGNYGWKAANYSQLSGMTLDEGIRYRLGTQRPSKTIMNMNEMQMNMDPQSDQLPSYFNSAEKWPGKIHEPLDQGNCAASWAFSTAAVASDRISIQSMGHMTPQLSPQNLISCDTRNQGGCAGGRVDGAWWYLRRRGVVTEDCYPYVPPQQTPAEVGRCMMQSRLVGRGKRQATQRCPNTVNYHNEIYQSTPPYRLSTNQKEIMKEIMDNGPVQAIMEVHEDFFVYKSGIYKHTDVSFTKPPQYRKHGTHSVRITGWGEDKNFDGTSRKYWIAANSWGKNWGENGYFRIARGENECEIEAFVIGVWGRIAMEDMHKHHHHHRRRHI
ncbi:tubulointerstitial nephritis antigen-like [Solea senegalensis]|uniref:Tubulointerstitial nephritis antigen-like n=1 Tax=Solea senegalensis TaxID=28829 RepID=A0AAV6R748_SOLSE|nr:tubulointerstitial nephritis antigen-like [Solea senegalensis]